MIVDVDVDVSGPVSVAALVNVSVTVDTIDTVDARGSLSSRILASDDLRS